jgi:hypothetical protein
MIESDNTMDTKELVAKYATVVAENETYRKRILQLEESNEKLLGRIDELLTEKFFYLKDKILCK